LLLLTYLYIAFLPEFYYFRLNKHMYIF